MSDLPPDMLAPVVVTGRLGGDPRFAAAGWRAVTTAPPHRRGAPVVVVDFRFGRPGAVAALGATISTAKGALVAILSDATQLPDAVSIGATHYLVEPFDAVALRAVLAMADRAAVPARPVPATPPTPPRAVEAVIAMGFRKFETINAAIGHEAGDAILAAAERRIAATVAPFAAAVRRGPGPIFLIDAGPGDPDPLARAVIARLERPFMAGEQLVGMEACAGVALVAGGPPDLAQRRALRALATAREEDHAVVRSSPVNDDAERLRDALGRDLRGAIDRGEIEILYQPQLSVARDTVVGVEALARWQHPVHGRLGADTLFATAGRVGALSLLSAEIRRRAADDAARWTGALAALRVAINVTAGDIARDGFAQDFLGLLAQTGLAPARATVEITEDALIDRLDVAANLFATLRAAGCRIAIDDFGTGYSSLAYLKALPLDYLKVDRRLTHDITGTARDRVVVRSVIDMARSLGLGVIAEGVETREQLARLAGEGCQYYQGFLAAEPMTGAELADWMTTRTPAII